MAKAGDFSFVFSPRLESRGKKEAILLFLEPDLMAETGVKECVLVLFALPFRVGLKRFSNNRL